MRLGSSCSPTATTSAASRASTRRCRSSRHSASGSSRVGIESPDFIPTISSASRRTTGGSYAAATSADALTKIYDELGFELGNEYLIRYRSSARPDQSVDVEVALVGEEPVAFSYESPSAGTAAPYKPAFWDELIQSWLLLPLVVLIVLGLVALAVRSLWSLRSNKALVSRLGDFVTLPAEERAVERRKEVDALLAAVNQEKQRREFRWLEGFAEDVDVAQIRSRPDQDDLGSPSSPGCCSGSLPASCSAHSGSSSPSRPPSCSTSSSAAAPAACGTSSREQLPENLDVLASALRAGHSLAGAMGVVADEAPEPSKREFSRVVTDEQLGIPLDEALEVTAKRMQNTDIDQVAILALVQREAGGNTAEVLDQVTKNIRARMDVRRLVKVLTAQGKFSSVVVALVPVGIFLFLVLVNPSHLDPLFHETLGQFASVMAVLMLGLGFFVIRKIVSIEL